MTGQQQQLSSLLDSIHPAVCLFNAGQLSCRVAAKLTAFSLNFELVFSEFNDFVSTYVF